MPNQVSRNLDAEKQALATFGKSYGKMPATPQEWAVANRLAYDSLDKLPDELRKPETEAVYAVPLSDLSKYMVGGATNPTAPLTMEEQNKQLQGKTASDLSAMNAANTQRNTMTQQGGTFFQTLQNALKAKTQTAQAGIGESELFKKAGLNSYDVLGQSLAQTNQQLETSHTELNNLITGLGGQWQAQAEVVKNNYDNAKAQYDQSFKALQDNLTTLRDNEEQLKRIRLQHDLDLEMEKWKMKNDPDKASWEIKEVIFTDEDGNEVKRSVQQNKMTGQIREIEGEASVNGKVITVGENDYDLSTYATDPEHVNKIRTIIKGFGKFNNAEELDAYLKSKGSVITSQEVQEASAKYQVPWELIVGLQQLESGLGTSNVAKTNNNPGGITWSQSYQDSHPGVVKGSPRPTEEGGNYVKFPTMQEGLNATVEQVANRKVDRPEGYYVSESVKNLVASSKYATALQRSSFNKLINTAMKTGGWPLAFEQAKTWMYNNEFQGSDKKEVKAADDQIMMFDKASELINRPIADDQSKFLTGPWNKIKEKDIKPWLGIDKQLATAEIRQWVAYGQAALRNGLFGSQLTEGEMNLSKDFLIDLDKDDIDVIKMKIKNLKEVAEYHRDLLYGKTMGVQQKDIPKKGPAMYGSLENQESTNDVNWVTDPSTGLEYRITE